MRPITLDAKELVYLRHLLEAEEGLGIVVASKGGDVLLVSCADMQDRLDAFIEDMKRELPISVGLTSAHEEAFNALQ